MTLAGWLILVASVGGTTAWIAWCLWKVLRTSKDAEKLHGIELRTPDQNDE